MNIPHPKITKVFPLKYFNIVLIVHTFFLQKVISQMCLFFISVVICLTSGKEQMNEDMSKEKFLEKMWIMNIIK